MARLLLVLLAACTTTDVVARRGADAAGMDGGSTDAGAGFCEGSGPLVLVGDGPGRLRCGGTVAQTTFRHALCVCDDLTSATALRTDAFDSREGFRDGGPGGSVGVNGALSASSTVAVGGSLRVVRPTTVAGGIDLTVRGTLLAGDRLNAAGGLEAGKELRAADAVLVGTLVTPRLVLPAGAELSLGPASEVGETVRESIGVSAPCDCAPDALLDVVALAERYREANDDAAIGLRPDALSALAEPTTLALPCGRYFVDRIAGAGLTLEVSGRAALFVRGELALDGPLDVRLREDGELDLFVAGNVLGRATWRLGDASTAARVRLYVGGSGTVNLEGGGTFAGNVYAPRAELVLPETLEVFGSVFVRRLAASGEVLIHYDEAVLDAGEDCPDPAEACTDCTDCRNQACIDGACGACVTDDDCCAPLVCAAGVCVTEPF